MNDVKKNTGNPYDLTSNTKARNKIINYIQKNPYDLSCGRINNGSIKNKFGLKLWK